MATALDIAKFFIGLANAQAELERGDPMTNLRLNKFLYFAQGYALGRLGRPLFEDRIEAWDKGPAVPSIYRRYKGSGSNFLKDEPFDESSVTEEEHNLLIEVFSTFDKYSTSELISITHQPGTPWDCVYEENASNEIPVASIKGYFEKNTPKRKLKAKIIYPLYNDENGTPVFSKEEVYGHT